ncbi:MAG: effector binding domain-containing protein [Ginsengibacter sp.]
MENISPFKIIGIAVETTNYNGKAAEDLGLLWKQFFNENVLGRIDNKLSGEIFAIYTDYASDYKGNYKAIIGLKVDSLATLTNDLIGQEFTGGNYKKFTAKGKLPGAVAETWKEIWERDKELNRKYTADFEVYGDRSQNGENAEVDIFIAVK